MNLFDPPPDITEYQKWDRTATRPLTCPALGEGSLGRRSRDVRLSALMLGRERERRERRVITSPWTGRKYEIVR